MILEVRELRGLHLLLDSLSLLWVPLGPSWAERPWRDILLHRAALVDLSLQQGPSGQGPRAHPSDLAAHCPLADPSPHLYQQRRHCRALPEAPDVQVVQEVLPSLEDPVLHLGLYLLLYPLLMDLEVLEVQLGQ